LLLTEITADRIAKFQLQRLRDGASNREVNMEISILRMVLRKHRFWHLIAPDYHPLPEPEDKGRALEAEEVDKLLTAINSRSRFLFPALMTYLHTGVRGAELRKMRWHQVDLIRVRDIRVGTCAVSFFGVNILA